MLEIAVVIGFLTVAVSILVKLIGFPDQIRKNFKRKSTEGLSTYFYILSFLVYVLWTTHGFLQKDRVLILGQSLGIVTTGIILYQIFLYRNKK